jgi:hypothetical protein
MPDSAQPNYISSLELALLQALCASVDVHAVLEHGTSIPTGFEWQNPDHGIVYAALCKVPNRDRRPLREQLPAIATRMGFPDIDWEAYFVAGAAVVAEQEILEIVRKLVAASTQA